MLILKVKKYDISSPVLKYHLLDTPERKEVMDFIDFLLSKRKKQVYKDPAND